MKIKCRKYYSIIKASIIQEGLEQKRMRNRVEGMSRFLWIFSHGETFAATSSDDFVVFNFLGVNNLKN